MDKDYQNFVERMGSFDDDLDVITGKKEENLAHHGIKGMRWGVRRTEAQLGTSKKVFDASKNIVGETKNINSAARSARTTAKYKEAESLTDQELKDRVARMNLEQQYSNLSAAKTSRGQAYVQNTLEVAGSVLAIAGSAATIALAVKQLKGLKG